MNDTLHIINWSERCNFFSTNQEIRLPIQSILYKIKEIENIHLGKFALGKLISM